MKLFVWSCGCLWVERGFLLHYGTTKDTGKEYASEVLQISNTQFYIEHPKAKIVFDLGWTLEDFNKFPGFPQRRGPEGLFVKQEPDENPIAQLKKLGVKIDDIDYVVISHLMLEHAGWLPLFAGKKAKIIVQYKEYEYAQRIGTYNPPEALESALEQFHSWMYYRKHFDIPGLNFELIEGDVELVKDVNILHVPGHTPGYQVLALKLPKTGTVVLSNCENRRNYYDIPINGTAPGIPHGITWFAAGELQQIKKIRDLVKKEEGQIFFGHDWEQFLTLKHAPQYYG
jgi:N-acyl homoserine lactone hydrolase